MKLLIDTDLAWSASYPSNLPPARREQIEGQLEDFKMAAKDFALSCKVETSETGARLRINAQKVTLSDQAMNRLFCEVLSPFFDLTLQHVALGGEGCDFAMEVVTSVPKLELPTTVCPQA